MPLINRMRSFGIIWIRINDPRSLGPKCTIGTDDPTQARIYRLRMLLFTIHTPVILDLDLDPDHSKKPHSFKSFECFCQAKMKTGLLRKFCDVPRFSKRTRLKVAFTKPDS